MTDKAMSPLRRRMIEDMTIRKFAHKTQHDYVQRVKKFAAFLGRSPATAKLEDVRRYRLHLASSGAGTPTINGTVATLRFFFNVTLDRADLAKHLSFVHEPRKLPVVLSPEEVVRFLKAAPSIKYKAALSVAYGAGLRVSEVVSLPIGIVIVVALATCAATGPLAAMIVTRRLTKSVASSDSRSNLVYAHRYSSATFCPSTEPCSLSPLRNPVTKSALVSGEPGWRFRLSAAQAAGQPRRAACHRRAAQKRDELAPPQPIELHWKAGYRIGRDQSAGMKSILQPAHW